MNVELAPGTIWWVRESEDATAYLVVVTGILNDEQHQCISVYTADEEGLGRWDFGSFIEIARPAHRILGDSR